MSVFKIHHITKYEYDRPVKESNNEIKIYPYPCAEQEVLQHDLHITNHPDVQTFFDYWGNKSGVFSVLPPHKQLVIDSRLMVRTIADSEVKVNFESTRSDLLREMDDNLHLLELATPHSNSSSNAIDNILQQLQIENNSIAGIVEQCSQYIYNNFRYVKGITNVQTTVEEILEHKSGVCQDFANVLLRLLRTLNVPGRYVSGYVCPNKNGMRGEGATHAWVEAWVPNYGWAGIDPTNNVWVTNRHVKLAVGRHFKDCSPVKGTFKGPAKQSLSVHVSVSYEDGYTFEDVNNVALTRQGTAVEELLMEGYTAQQQ
jgi:transglutaminase-like putative cysteine protease